MDNSFLFGVGTNNSISDNDDPKKEPLLNDKLDESYQLGYDMTLHIEPLLSATISIQWLHTFLLFLIIIIGLPLYVISILVRQENKLTKRNSYLIFLICTTIYVFLWIFIGLWSKYQGIYPMIDWKELIFVIGFYCICCFAEAVIKTTYIDNQSDDIEKQTRNIHIDVRYMNDNNLMDESAIRICDLILIIKREQISNYIYSIVRILSLILGIVFGIITEVIRWTEDGKNNNVNISGGFVIYIIIGFILRSVLSSFIFFYLGEALTQLYLRFIQSNLFQSLSSVTLSKKKLLPYIRLNSENNIQGWKILRATLLHEYQQPKIYIDIILSTCFGIWIPLSIITIIHIIFKYNISMFLIMCLTESIFIFIYLIICIHIAAKTRNEFNQISLLHLEEYRLLCAKEDKSKEIKIIKKLRQIMEIGINDAIVFKIFGIGINQNFTTILISFVITAVTTIFTKLIM